MKISLLCLVLVLAVCLEAPALAAPHAAHDSAIESVERLLALPDDKVDLGRAKLAIDKLVDPSMDVLAVDRQIDAMTGSVRDQFPAGASDQVKLDILLRWIYKPGPWNGNRAFTYDLDDPLGSNPRAKLLTSYLVTHKGNCVSMPELFAILGQRLGLTVTLAIAPNHMLVKFADNQTHTWLNVEATGGGFKYDSSYERETGISQRAIETQIYLRPLTPREAVASMLSELMEFYGSTGQQERRIAVANLALAANPKDVVAMLHRSAGDYLLLQQRYARRYPTPAQIPADELADYQALSKDNLAWMAKAESLGWVAPTKAQEAEYLDTIRRAKATQRTPND